MIDKLSNINIGNSQNKRVTDENRDKEANIKVSKSSQNVFERLTDPMMYGGTHQHRFDAEGKGLGLSGRDSPAKGKGHVHTGQRARSLSRPEKMSGRYGRVKSTGAALRQTYAKDSARLEITRLKLVGKI